MRNSVTRLARFNLSSIEALVPDEETIETLRELGVLNEYLDLLVYLRDEDLFFRERDVTKASCRDRYKQFTHVFYMMFFALHKTKEYYNDYRINRTQEQSAETVPSSDSDGSENVGQPTLQE